MILKGKKISLRPMVLEDIKKFYEWATASDGSAYWYGELYGNEAPSYEKFCSSWKPHYFTDEHPELGRCFMILLDGKGIGQIDYNKIENGRTEIDILIADSENMGKGYGPDAIDTLVRYLFDSMGVNEVWVAAIKKNPRAIRAYQKAGFEVGPPHDGLESDPYWKDKKFDDWVFLYYRKR